MTGPSDADALLILSDQLEERGMDAGARLLRDIAVRIGARPAPSWPVGRTLDRAEAINLAYRAISLFGHRYANHHERIGALIEAMGLYCEESKRVAPDLWMDSCQYAARLTDERRKHDPEWQAELARLRNSIEPWIVSIERGRLIDEAPEVPAK